MALNEVKLDKLFKNWKKERLFRLKVRGYHDWWYPLHV